MIVATVLTQTIRIYSTANIRRSGIVTTTKIANDIADTLDVSLLWIADSSFREGATGMGIDDRPPPTVNGSLSMLK
jgi:hypothetical protein